MNGVRLCPLPYPRDHRLSPRDNKIYGTSVCANERESRRKEEVGATTRTEQKVEKKII